MRIAQKTPAIDKVAAPVPVLPTREDCRDGPRPCPHVSCRHHLLLEVTDAGSLRILQPTTDVSAMGETCSLDLAERGTMSLDQIGQILKLSRERIRQLEETALVRLRDALEGQGILPDEVMNFLSETNGCNTSSVYAERSLDHGLVAEVLKAATETLKRLDGGTRTPSKIRFGRQPTQKVEPTHV